MSSHIHEWKDHIVSYVFLIAIILALGIGVLAAKPSSTQCNDHIDNDGNGYCDYKTGGSYCKNGSVTLGDPGCSSKQDNTESSPALCGNNVVETGEVCDGRSQSCTTSGGYPGTQQCNLQCNGWNNCTSTFYCGDGSVDGSEVCDYNDPVSGTRGNCTTANGYAGSERCDSYCGGYLCTSTQFCGDGVKNGPESCDGSDLDGTTCQTQGFAMGTLSCTSQCTFDTAGCFNDNTTTSGNGVCGNGIPETDPSVYYNVENCANCPADVHCASGTVCYPSGTCQAPSCTDTDGGWNYSTKGTVTGYSGPFTDFCYSTTQVYEYACGTGPSGNPDAIGQPYTCTNGCQDGACAGAPSTEVCGNGVCTGGETAISCSQDCGTCTDTDGGIDYYVKGIVESLVGGRAVDNCPWELGGTTNTTALNEWYCSSGTRASVRFNCPNGCSAGKCN